MRLGVRLGVDVGSVRVGVARSDDGGVMASPLCTIRRDVKYGTDLDQLADLVDDHNVVEVIVGLPLTLDGKARIAAVKATEFAQELADLISPVSVRMVDERLSTTIAHNAMQSAGKNSRQRRPLVDQAAAVVILDTALDVERATGQPPGALHPPRQDEIS